MTDEAAPDVPARHGPARDVPPPDVPPPDVVTQLLAFVDQTSDLVGVVDETSQVLYLNDAARKRLGIGAATDLTTAHLFPPQVFARYYDEIRPALLRNGSWRGELPVLTASDAALPMALTIVARTGPAGEITGLVTLARELSAKEPVDLMGQFVHDDLTGLPRRAILDDRTRVALVRAARDGNCVALVVVDVDAMKDVNDTYGHAAGDDVLRVLAHRMTRVVRTSDTVARVGGDEFVLLFDGVDSAESAFALAERVRDAIAHHEIRTGDGELHVTASFGIAIGGAHDEPAELLARADTAMYRAKALGAGHAIVFDDDSDVSVRTIADEFAVAVSHGQIRPHVQPIVDLRTGVLVGYQGLARWEHGERGTLDAGDFIDLVVESPMAPVVDLAVFRRTAAAAARAARRGEHVRAYGHVSRRLLGDLDIEQYFVEIARDLALTAWDLCVEVAYPLVTRRSPAVAGALDTFHEAGIRTVLSNVDVECEVGAIVEYGFDEVRLARRLVRDAMTDGARRQVASATVALAHALELPVTAVGIESEAERDAMVELGCDLGEGRLFGSIVPAGDVD
jgi:diguanylate cyclase (GGDEF)-like protein